MATGLRRTYVHLYCLTQQDKRGAKRHDDGRLLAWSHYEAALAAAAGTGWIVTNISWFRAHVLPEIPAAEAPRAMLIMVTSYGGVTRYHAEMDASEDDLRTLCQTKPSEWARAPDRTAAKTAASKVWQEGDS